MESVMLGINIALAVLLALSEALPFIRSKDYNGLLHWLVLKMGKVYPVGIVEEKINSDINK
jgi:hypothetical protein